MPLQYRTRQSPGGEPGRWGPWEPLGDGGFTLYPKPTAVDVQVREKPPFEPGFFQDLNDVYHVAYLTEEPKNPDSWRRVVVSIWKEGD